MRQIGKIIQLQVQQEALKKGEGPDRSYDAGGILVVPAARLSSDGVTGIFGDREIHDVHHSQHPRSKHRRSSAISFNVSENYDRISRQFQFEQVVGYGGENLIIELVEGVDLAGILGNPEMTLLIGTMRRPQGMMTGIKVAKPCVPFSEYVLNQETKPSAELIKDTLQFLDDGMRGYYCSWEGESLIVEPGYGLFLLG